MILKGASKSQLIEQLETHQIDASLLAEIEHNSFATTLQDVEDCGSGLLLAMATCQSLLHTGNGAVAGNE